jgi:hypothetical protein
VIKSVPSLSLLLSAMRHGALIVHMVSGRVLGFVYREKACALRVPSDHLHVDMVYMVVGCLARKRSETNVLFAYPHRGMVSADNVVLGVVSGPEWEVGKLWMVQRQREWKPWLPSICFWNLGEAKDSNAREDVELLYRGEG